MPPRDPERIPISEFKAKSLALLERVRRTGRSIVVTKRGEPVAEVVPPSAAVLGRDWLGALRDSVRVRGDIVAPVSKPGDWEALGS
jgi:prevent-host-death family protein